MSREDDLKELFNDIDEDKMVKIFQWAQDQQAGTRGFGDPPITEPTIPETADQQRENLLIALRAVEPEVAAYINQRMIDLGWLEAERLTDIDYEEFPWIANMPGGNSMRDFTREIDQNPSRPAALWEANFDWQRMEPAVWGVVIVSGSLTPWLLRSGILGAGLYGAGRAPGTIEAFRQSLPAELGTFGQISRYPRELTRYAGRIWDPIQQSFVPGTTGIQQAGGELFPGATIEQLLAEGLPEEEATRLINLQNRQAQALLQRFQTTPGTPTAPTFRGLREFRALQGRGVPRGPPRIGFEQPGALSRFARTFRPAPAFRQLSALEKYNLARSGGYDPGALRTGYWSARERLAGAVPRFGRAGGAFGFPTGSPYQFPRASLPGFGEQLGFTGQNLAAGAGAFGSVLGQALLSGSLYSAAGAATPIAAMIAQREIINATPKWSEYLEKTGQGWRKYAVGFGAPNINEQVAAGYTLAGKNSFFNEFITNAPKAIAKILPKTPARLTQVPPRGITLRGAFGSLGGFP